jgi:hypothetical protein
MFLGGQYVIGHLVGQPLHAVLTGMPGGRLAW